MTAPSAEVKEVRLALVCYGGVSLAIYMHGVTKEIFKLVRASRAFDADRALTTPLPAGAPSSQQAADWDTEHVYYQALKSIADAKSPLSITVDIIGGTSAGGINGVCLARGIAGSRSLDGFRDLWIDEGSIRVLVERRPRFKLFGQHGVLESLRRVVGERIRLEGLVGAPLNGNKMSRMLCQAFEGMDRLAAPTPATLLPDGGGIELLVTTTDVEGYDVLVDSGSGGVINHDKAYRQVLRFVAPGDVDDFEDDGAVAALTFAARATSSFPGAFPPVSVGSFKDSLADLDAPPTFQPEDITRHFSYGTEYGVHPDRAWYVDGGVLDNAPYDHVVDAISKKPAEIETSRHLIYIQPDPGQNPVSNDGAPGEPTWFKTVHESISTIPKHKPTMDALTRLREMNERIAEIGTIAKTQAAAVIAALPVSTTTDLSYQATVQGAGAVRTASQTAAGQTYGAYCRLRADGAAKDFAAGLSARLGYPLDSNECSFVTEVLIEWVQGTAAWSTASPTALEDELTQADIGFRDRRARFIAHGVNDLFVQSDAHTWQPPRADLVAIKAACWNLVELLETVAAGVLDDVADQASAIVGPKVLGDAMRSDPSAFVAANFEALNSLFTSYRGSLVSRLKGTSETLWNTMTASTAGWAGAGVDAAATRDALLSRYLAFPIWDVLIYPVIALSELPQLTSIKVTRFSPLDATALPPIGGDGRAEQEGHKLKGRVFFHFGGFFDKKWRENDYLWGRLDAVELILKLLGAEGGTALPDPLREDGFRQVLDSERTALSAIDDVISALRGRLTPSAGG